MEKRKAKRAKLGLTEADLIAFMQEKMIEVDRIIEHLLQLKKGEIKDDTKKT